MGVHLDGRATLEGALLRGMNTAEKTPLPAARAGGGGGRGSRDWSSLAPQGAPAWAAPVEAAARPAGRGVVQLPSPKPSHRCEVRTAAKAAGKFSPQPSFTLRGLLEPLPSPRRAAGGDYGSCSPQAAAAAAKRSRGKDRVGGEAAKSGRPPAPPSSPAAAKALCARSGTHRLRPSPARRSSGRPGSALDWRC